MERLLECPNCRRIANQAGGFGRQGDRCPACGFRFLTPLHKTEDEVRERLYGRPAARPYEREIGERAV